MRATEGRKSEELMLLESDPDCQTCQTQIQACILELARRLDAGVAGRQGKCDSQPSMTASKHGPPVKMCVNRYEAGTPSMPTMYFVTPCILAGLAGTPLLSRWTDGPYRLPNPVRSPPARPPALALSPLCAQLASNKTAITSLLSPDSAPDNNNLHNFPLPSPPPPQSPLVKSTLHSLGTSLNNPFVKQ